MAGLTGVIKTVALPLPTAPALDPRPKWREFVGQEPLHHDSGWSQLRTAAKEPRLADGRLQQGCEFQHAHGFDALGQRKALGAGIGDERSRRFQILTCQVEALVELG